MIIFACRAVFFRPPVSLRRRAMLNDMETLFCGPAEGPCYRFWQGSSRGANRKTGGTVTRQSLLVRPVFLREKRHAQGRPDGTAQIGHFYRSFGSSSEPLYVYEFDAIPMVMYGDSLKTFSLLNTLWTASLTNATLPCVPHCRFLPPPCSQGCRSSHSISFSESSTSRLGYGGATACCLRTEASSRTPTADDKEFIMAEVANHFLKGCAPCCAMSLAGWHTPLF